MNVGLVVDATCDLPSSILERFQVEILPTKVSVKQNQFEDTRDLEATLEFYNDYSATHLNSALSHAVTIPAFINTLKEELIYHYDNLLIIAPHIKLSDSLHSIREAILEAHPEFERLRKEAHLKNTFRVRVIESQTGFAGYGLTLYEAMRLMGEKARTADQLKKPLEQFKYSVETHILPGAHNISSQILSQQPFNVGWISLKKLQLSNSMPAFRVTENGIEQHGQFKVSNAENEFLKKVYDEITRTNLSNHLVNISYAGKLSKLRVLPAFTALHEHVKSKGGRLVHSVMSPTSGAQLGAGAITIAFSGKN